VGVSERGVVRAGGGVGKERGYTVEEEERGSGEQGVDGSGGWMEEGKGGGRDGLAAGWGGKLA